MTRPKLSLAGRAPKRQAVPLSLVKQALRLFAGRGVPREVRHANARKWLAARLAMGDRHVYNKEFQPRWGQPGDGKGVGQVFAPRRLGDAS